MECFIEQLMAVTICVHSNGMLRYVLIVMCLRRSLWDLEFIMYADRVLNKCL